MFPGNLDPSSKALGEVRSGVQDSDVSICTPILLLWYRDESFGQHFKLSLETFQSKRVFSPSFVLHLFNKKAEFLVFYIFMLLLNFTIVMKHFTVFHVFCVIQSTSIVIQCIFL